MRTSALAPMAAAIIAAVEADVTLVALIPDGIHQGTAPTDADGSYLTINTPSESASNLFGTKGTENGEQIHVWANSQNAVRLIAMELMRVLGDGAVTVAGFTLIARQVNLITILHDPDAAKWHGVVRLVARLNEWYDWDPTDATVLFVEASAQAAGSQVVASTIGPNGWLGDSASDAVNDPTLVLTDPARWVMSGGGRLRVSFGDVFEDVFDDPDGFTMVFVGHPGDTVGPGAGVTVTLINKDRDSVSTTPHGVWLSVVDDVLQLQIHFDGTTGFSHVDIGQSDAGSVTPDTTVIGVHYDRLATRGDRVGFWFDGAQGGAAEANIGNEGVIDTSGVSLTIGGDHGSGILAPKFASAFVLARGVMPASWHQGLYKYMLDRGWS